MAQIMTVGQRLRLTVEGRAGGRTGRFAGAVSWAVTPAFLSLVPSADGLTCVARAIAAGDCQVEASAAGLASGTFAVSVLAADATELVISGQVLGP